MKKISLTSQWSESFKPEVFSVKNNRSFELKNKRLVFFDLDFGEFYQNHDFKLFENILFLRVFFLISRFDIFQIISNVFSACFFIKNVIISPSDFSTFRIFEFWKISFFQFFRKKKMIFEKNEKYILKALIESVRMVVLSSSDLTYKKSCSVLKNSCGRNVPDLLITFQPEI